MGTTPEHWLYHEASSTVLSVPLLPPCKLWQVVVVYYTEEATEAWHEHKKKLWWCVR